MDGMEVFKLVVAIVMPVLSITTIINTWMLYTWGNKTKRIDTLESDVNTAARTVIDERILAASQQHQSSMRLVEQRLQQIDKRLDFGEQRFTKLEEKDHKLEIDVLRAIKELQEKVATRDDLKRLREELKGD